MKKVIVLLCITLFVWCSQFFSAIALESSTLKENTTNIITQIGNFSKEMVESAEERLAEETRVQGVKRTLETMKQIAESRYSAEMKIQTDFIEQYGKLASEMSDADIKKVFSDEYFDERLLELGFFRDDSKDRRLNKRNAVIRAQSNYNIPITGVLDLTTKRVLIQDTDLLPIDRITGEHPQGMWVTINKSVRILTVYIDDQVYKKYPVAVGRNISLTPTGQYTFVTKHKNPRWGGGGYAAPVPGGVPSNPLGKRWIGISKGGGGRYGVHGNASPYSIGTNASHGCVRMINSDVEELFEYIEISTPVWIGTTETMNEWGISAGLEPQVPIKPDLQQIEDVYLNFI